MFMVGRRTPHITGAYAPCDLAIGNAPVWPPFQVTGASVPRPPARLGGSALGEALDRNRTGDLAFFDEDTAARVTPLDFGATPRQCRSSERRSEVAYRGRPLSSQDFEDVGGVPPEILPERGVTRYSPIRPRHLPRRKPH